MKLVYICANHRVRYWYRKHRGNSEGQGVESKAVKQTLVCYKMYRCFLRQSSLETSLLLIGHLKRKHGVYPGIHLRLKCGQVGCTVQFLSHSGLRRHLNEIHAHAEHNDVPQKTSADDHREEPRSSDKDLNGHTPNFCSKQLWCRKAYKFSSKASIIAKPLGGSVPSVLQIEAQATVSHTNWVRCSGVEHRVGLCLYRQQQSASVQQNNYHFSQWESGLCFDWTCNLGPWPLSCFSS